MKEEVESVYLKDDTSFKKIVKQEQARRHLKKQQPKEKLVVAINRWKAMQMLEELLQTIMPQQEYSMLVKEHGLTVVLRRASFGAIVVEKRWAEP